MRTRERFVVTLSQDSGTSTRSVAEGVLRFVDRLDPGVALGTGPIVSEALAVVVDHLADVDGATVMRAGSTRRPWPSVGVAGALGAEGDEEQRRAGSGPAVDAVSHAVVVVADDLASDPRWPALHAAARLRSALCFPVRSLSGHAGDRSALNLYSCSPGAFTTSCRDDVLEACALLALLLRAVELRQRTWQVEEALDGNRRIGVATGLLMAAYGCTHDEALAAMKRYSQVHNVKLRDLADEVASIGTLPGTSSARRLAGGH